MGMWRDPLEECTTISRAEGVLERYTENYVPNGIPKDQLDQDFRDATENLYKVFQGASHLLMETVLGEGLSDTLRDK
ncbi:hypothetical protein [Bacillus thuringiensis]|uniref:hypothetical protein n=1 Tax=Bacillus thuringiensis TaxID=1428 RepID=UPI001671F08A|nr:hypothetical protein [Bacillus thuringiensis]